MKHIERRRNIIYQRIDNRGAYKRVTTVKENGDYEQVIVWADGTMRRDIKDNLFNMGWSSVKEFLRARPRFKKVDGEG